MQKILNGSLETQVIITEKMDRFDLVQLCSQPYQHIWTEMVNQRAS